MNYVREETVIALNNLLKQCFQMNSFSDNIAYSLDVDFNCNIATKIYHEKWAHKFPEFADELSDFMSKLNIRPVRGMLDSNDKIYSNSCIDEVFNDNLAAIHQFRQEVINAIQVAEENGDREVVIFLEDFWMNKLNYLKQAQIWAKKTQEYINDIAAFDKDFPRFTNMID